MFDAILLLNALNITTYGLNACTLRLAATLNLQRILYVVDDAKDLPAFEGSVLIYNVKSKYDIKYFNYDGMVIDVQRLEDLDTFLDAHYNYASWNKSALAINTNVDPNFIDSILRLFWKYYVLKLVILTIEEEVYYYRQGCESLVLTHIVNCGDSSESPQFKSDSKARKKCVVKVAAAKLPPYVINASDTANPGYEVLMLREIAFRAGLRLEYVSHNYSNHGERINGFFTGLYRLLNEKEVDVVMGAAKAEGYHAEVFEGAYPFASMQMGLFVQAAQLQVVSNRFTDVFKVSIWFAIVVTSMAIVATFFFFDLLNIRNKGVLCHAFLVLNITFSSYTLKSNYAPVNIIYLIWCFASLLVLTLFTNNFMASLAIPSYDKQLNTLQDIQNAGLKVGGYVVTRKVAMDQNATFDVVYDNWVNCSLIGQECLQRVLDGKMAIVKSSAATYYLLGNANEKLIHRCSVLTYNLVWLVMRKGLPLAAVANSLILRMIQVGLLQKWERDTMMVSKRDAIAIEENGPRGMPGMFLWISGLVIATIAFLFEVLLRRRKSSMEMHTIY